MPAHGHRPPNPRNVTPRGRNRRLPPPPPRRDGRSTIDGCAVMALALAGGLLAGLAGLVYGATQVVLAL